MSKVALGAAAVATAAVLFRGADASLGPTLGLLVLGFCGLGVLMAAERRRPRLRPNAVLATSGALLALAVVVPPLQSNDVWSYTMYGRIVAHYHVSPYRALPSDFRHDRWFARVDRRWRDTPSVYGPLFTGLSAAGMALAGGSFLVGRLFFQGLAALAVALALLLVWRETRSPAAVAVLGVNPFVIISLVNGAHNDTLVGLAVVAGVVLAVKKHPLLAGTVLALATLVKLAALLPLAGVVLWALRQRGARTAAALAGTGVVIVLVGYSLVGGTAALDPLREVRRNVSGASIWNGPREVLLRDGVDDGMRRDDARALASNRVATWATIAALALAALLVVRRLGHPSPALAAGGAVMGYALVGAYVLPWYLAWGIFALALCWRSRLTALALAHGALLQLAYSPDPHLPRELDRLLVLDPLDRLQVDVRQLVLPLLEVAAVLVVVAMSARRQRSHAPGPAAP